MSKWKGIVSQSFTPATFEAYIRSLTFTWKPQFIVLHNTFVPTLTQRPNGFTLQHIKNLQSYFRDQKGWSAGPHLFIDDKQIWVFTPLTTSGVHSPSWNSKSLGIEMLGDYEKESFSTGRGLMVHNNTVAAIAILNKALGLTADKLRLHKEDPKTTHKTCPGKNVVKADVIEQVVSRMS